MLWPILITAAILAAFLLIWSLCRAAAEIEDVRPDCGEYESGGRDD